MPTFTEQANALVPGDWSSLRDVIRAMAATVDKLISKPGKGGNDASGDGASDISSAPDGSATN